MNNRHDRREFLKGATLLSLGGATFASAAGAAPAAGPAPHPEPAVPNGPASPTPPPGAETFKRVLSSRLKIAVNAYSFARLLNDNVHGRGNNGISLFDLIDFCARNNVDGVDATGYFFPEYPKSPSPSYVNALKRRAFEAGVTICGTGVRNNMTVGDKAKRAADVQHIKDWIEVASRLGAPVLRVFADTQMRGGDWKAVSGGATREQVEAWIADDLRACAEHGKKWGVIIGVQNHGDFLRSSDDQLNLVKRIGSEWCGPIVDTGYYKTKDPYADIAKVAPFAVNWQIKESPFGAESPVRTDLTKLVRIIRASHYRGFIPVETLAPKTAEYDPFTVVPRFLKELRRAVDQTEAA